MFKDRTDAGRQLADALAPYQREDAIILALPRGGVLVGSEIAQRLNKPLDILVVRKVGAPWHEELAVGAVGPGEVLFLNRHLINSLGIPENLLNERIHRERAELERRLKRFRGNRLFPDLQNRTIILVDDGLATGATARAAIEAVKALGAGKVVLAVPVGAQSTVSMLRREVDDLICLEQPEDFQAVSLWYQQFPQNSDTEVIHLLEKAWGHTEGIHNTMSRSIGPP
jgi:predicted phosphoribosyltransferase